MIFYRSWSRLNFLLKWELNVVSLSYIYDQDVMKYVDISGDVSPCYIASLGIV